ncbi:gamma-glutamyl hydrolase 2-like [Rutidosis leptorrhynchoides]|uniref:gamma-glutamyl hydrolase 2-like n=1 Tax=Rutidosis leptorrhynchoides TaxID=125765 RepID=UPI003A99414A
MTKPSIMLNYIWILILISVLNEVSFVTVAYKKSTILLPSESVTVMTATCPAPDPSLNYRPVIGIVTHPGDGASGRLSNATNASYIAASYVKFVESAGARVIPLIYNEPLETLQMKLNLVNGVLFTGGWSKTGLYFDVIEGIFKHVLKKNDAGEHFPLLAICLGFELLTMIVSKNNNILESFSASDQASTLQFMNNVNIDGTLFQRFPSDLVAKLSTECLVMQNHKYGISPETFLRNTELCSFFTILTTSADENNKAYVSTAQSKSYPVTAVQWHPEKNAFEWASSAIPHSDDAIQVTQHVANFFVSEARKSFNRPSTQQVLDNLIYNYKPTYCGSAGTGYDEVYIFAETEKTACL